MGNTAIGVELTWEEDGDHPREKEPKSERVDGLPPSSCPDPGSQRRRRRVRGFGDPFLTLPGVVRPSHRRTAPPLHPVRATLDEGFLSGIGSEYPDLNPSPPSLLVWVLSVQGLGPHI